MWITHLVWREFSVGVIGGGESGRLQGREGGVEQRRVKCCRTEDFETIDSKSSNKQRGTPCQLGEEKCTGLCEMAQVTR